ncbi:hypothetical protein SPRG_03321 [Saprolegnia parasitica CBS 223.65]|uniref:PX domain-containing protein n=1 Tax=Saprolegnia parasitica (strain CBS 223.65) TaxID=695850 RepID=A0A067CNM2_SAPPC|nr:hypothetical protein SPRG_03321 [Saprolegnia parasitica CBS 223.65]KDO32103.1 hypothetical protein SPRG_03321 [Saprolegnia parasitica CBS 223.65]|eukprot:XP_012197288.1 hypothetical protein SPRG_03321 [Saprolegnia parasitica CBS 223.65]
MEKAAATRRPSPLLPPTPVAAVAVQGHALVLKEARVGSRRRLNLDTMMSRRPYHVVFDLLVSDASTSPPETIHRSYAQFQALHHQLRKKYPRSPLVALPSMKLGRFDSAYIQLKYPELEQFLQQLLSLECISTSDLLSRFFREPTLAASDGSDDDDVLPPSDATTVTIRKGQSYSVSLEIPTAHAAVAYQFATRKHDIGFSITLNDDTLQVYSREAALKGLVRCPTPGLCTLTWDNSYVWHRSKVVTYHAEVVAMSPRSQSPKPRSAETSRVSDTSAETPTGYIAHVHRAPILLSPRRLVHTSMRKIIGWSKPEPWLKAGPMIIQRRHTKLKHALLHGGGESWYRKWFTLDGNNGILRCYDNQASVTRVLKAA